MGDGEMKKRIVIADDEPITRMDLKEILTEAGYDVVGEASDGFDAIELCKKLRPDMVLMDIKMPLLDGLKASKIINEKQYAGCIILLTAYSDKHMINEATKAGVMGYMVKPIDEKALIPTLEVAWSKQGELDHMKQNVEAIKGELETRKKIEKAKGILMKRDGLTEDEAYKYIRKLSMDKRCQMVDIADIILINE